MKKTALLSRWIFIIAILPLLLISCGQRQAVKQVADAFLQAYYVDHKFDVARAFCTQASYENIDFRATLFTLNPNADAESVNAFEILDFEILKTKAECTYQVLSKDGQTIKGNQKRRLNLSKVNNKWLVDMPETTTSNQDGMLSLSFSILESGGFASAESAPTRLGDIPQSSDN
ncbi:MAG: hypothetical protein LBU91_08645 [Bacteroidales bacterium]|jgi:hypothetical protein|nr:hypothetical protein [Bacteroidales bacterium]